MTKQELQGGLDCLLPEMKKDVEKCLANLMSHSDELKQLRGEYGSNFILPKMAACMAFKRVMEDYMPHGVDEADLKRLEWMCTKY